MWFKKKKPSSETEYVNEYYREGMLAYKKGLYFWECPYVQLTSDKTALNDWLAGWMAAKQDANK